MRDMVQEVFGVMPLPDKCCGKCKAWTRAQPDDMTAAEGRCGLSADPGAWPAIWPHTLQRDRCSKFKPS